MKVVQPQTGYSAQVRLHLEISDARIPLAQVAPNWVILAEPQDLDPCEANVIVETDGHEHRRRVMLAEGVSKTSKRVTIMPLQQVDAAALGRG